jgi:hypothetical protein
MLGYVPQIKAIEVFNLSSPSNSEIKNGWSSASISAVCLHGMNRDSLAFKPLKKF